MKPLIAACIVALSLVAQTGCAAVHTAATSSTPTTASSTAPERINPMQLGNFSVSLAVKDLSASRAFYEKLGFTQFGGEASQNWLIMKNGTTNIGLFQGMFPNNIMTFNPGWTSDAEAVESFRDVRDIQAALQEQGLEMNPAADPESSGPASFVIVDPDGNAVLFDQHVPRPGN